MKALLSVVSIVMFTQSVLAEVIYTCTPARPTSLFSEVVLSNPEGPAYLLTISKVESIAGKTEQSATAEYYDDMTYFGYYSETLNANLEFDSPVNLKEMARFYLGETAVYVNCK